MINMKNQTWIPMFILSLGISACTEKETPTSKNNDADTIQSVDTLENSTDTTEAVTLEEETINEDEPILEGAAIGALLGAAAGGIIGHQSGAALEGAAIGEAQSNESEIDEQADTPEEQ